MVFGDCGAGLPVGLGVGSMCGCAVPGGCPSRVPTAPVFVGLGTALLPAGDARCPWIPVAAWCCGGCHFAASLDARSCRGLCGVPALDGAGAAVVRVALAACCWCGVVTAASGAEVDGPEDVGAVGPSRVRRPGPLGSCSPVCPLGVLFCVCGVLGHLPHVHRCTRSVRCFAHAVSWATWLLVTGVPARWVLLCVCGVLGHLAPVHRCARSVCCVACAVSWATWLLFTGAPAPSFALLVRCPVPLGSCSPVCPLGVLFCVSGVLGHLAPVHRCARSVCCFACAVSWATWLLFTGVPPRCVVLLVRCPGSIGSCSPVCPLGGLRCVYGVLGRLALVHRCAPSVCCALGCACGGGCVRRHCGALTRPSRRRLFVACRGWVPSGRPLVHPDGGCS